MDGLRDCRRVDPKQAGSAGAHLINEGLTAHFASDAGRRGNGPRRR